MAEYELSERIADTILPEVVNTSAELSKEAFDESVPLLKSAASNYIMQYGELSKQIADFEGTLRRQAQLRHSFKESYGMLDEYIANKQSIADFLHGPIPKKLYAASFEFQNLLNEVLGQKVTMVFVFDDGNGPELYEIKSEDVLKYDYSSGNKLVARYNLNAQDMSSSLQKLQIDDHLNFNYDNLKSTYQETIYRYRCARQAKNKVVIYELPPTVWNAVKVSAEGDINEAYASIVILNRSVPGFHGDMESNIAEFLDQVKLVDNESGLLRGDVTKDNVEYGIKSAQASTLSLTQMVNLAKEILNTDNYDIEKLRAKQQEFHEKRRPRNRMTKLSDAKLQDILSVIQEKRK